jgi:hypothetical protein
MDLKILMQAGMRLLKRIMPLSVKIAVQQTIEGTTGVSYKGRNFLYLPSYIDCISIVR